MALAALTKRITRTAAPVIHLTGEAGVGKTTLVASAPNAFLIRTEPGVLDGIEYDGTDVITSWTPFEEVMTALIAETHDYAVVGIDNLTALVPAIFDQVCRREGWSSIESPGYGKGYVSAAENEVARLVRGFAKLAAKGITVVHLGHVAKVKVEEPDAPAYTRYESRLHRAVAAPVMEQADAVLHLATRVQRRQEEAGFGSSRTIVSGGTERVLHCDASAGRVAKNRLSMPAEIVVPKDDPWGAVAPYLAPPAARPAAKADKAKAAA